MGGPESALTQIPQATGDTRDGIPNEHAQRSTLHTAMALVRARVLPPTWEAFCSVAVECRDGGEVAAKLHMTPGAVREAVYHVRQLLKECVTQLVKVRNDSA